MVSTQPGDHNNHKIKIGQTSKFSAILIMILMFKKLLGTRFTFSENVDIFSTILWKAPSSEIQRR